MASISRKQLAIILVMLIISSVAIWSIYNQTIKRQNQVNDSEIVAKITDFQVSNPDVLVWGWVNWNFTVTKQNFP